MTGADDLLARGKAAAERVAAEHNGHERELSNALDSFEPDHIPLPPEPPEDPYQDRVEAPRGDVAQQFTVATLSDVTPEKVSWLWRGRLPLGKVVTLDGDP